MIRMVLCLLLAVSLGITAKAQNLVKNGDAENGLENWDKAQVQLATENPHSGKNCFKMLLNTVSSNELIPVNTDTIYKISAFFKSADDKKTILYLGFMPFTEEKRLIEVLNINPEPGTETELVEECISEDKILKVKDAGKWQAQPLFKIAFNVDPSGDYKDLPNFNISPGNIISTENKGHYWEVKLDKPCANSFPAKNKIRLHKGGGTYIYALVKDGYSSQTWQELSATVRDYANFGASTGKFWKGTKYVKIVILARSGGLFYFDDVKLEEMK